MSSSLRTGAWLAVLAALSFGLTTPIISRAGVAVGPLTTAALLYAGAWASSALPTRRAGAPLGRAQLGRLLAIALFGAALAPTLFVWGLQRAGPSTSALLLNLEAVFTVALAWAVFHEPIGRRVLLALGLMVVGGALVAPGLPHTASLLGALAVTGATAAWAVDNALTRKLADHDPVQVVGWKGGLGAVVTTTLAVAFHEAAPSLGASAVLLVCGATGYGLSLRLYLLAQRRIGAARTASIFALAPFVGALLAWLLGDSTASWWSLAAAMFFALGIALHLTEQHHHPHLHVAVDHEHLHRHDDGHHLHRHDPPVEGEHSHPHHHEALAHEHDHGPDVHHEHTHA